MPSLPKFLTALPVYNEARHVCRVLDEVVRYADDVLVVDDGSSDGTAELLAARRDVTVIRHAENRGYGAGAQDGVRVRYSARLSSAGDDRLRWSARAAAHSPTRRRVQHG